MRDTTSIRQAVLMRTTPTSLLDRGVRAAAAALSVQLHGQLTLLVDTTFCVADFCVAQWIGRSLGVATWGYSADDVAQRWPSVVWPVLGATDRPDPSDNMRCWLLMRLARQLETIGRTPWPRGERTTEGLRVSRSARTRPELAAVNYLIHEPSVILWWLAHADALHDIGHIWVLEDDVLFGGSAPHFFRRFEHQRADMVSLFCEFSQKCSARKAPGLVDGPERFADDSRGTRGDWVHHGEHVARFSTRLLMALDRELQAGRVLHGEFFASTFCVRDAPWCTTQDIRSVDAASASMRDDGLKLNSADTPLEDRWHHVETSLLCELLTRRNRSSGHTLRGRVSAECAQPRPWAGSPNYRVDLLGSPADARSVAPVMRLIDAQNCNRCCSTGDSWCCLNSSAWKQGLAAASSHKRHT